MLASRGGGGGADSLTETTLTLVVFVEFVMTPTRLALRSSFAPAVPADATAA